MTTANRRTTYIIKIAMVAVFAAMSFVCTAFLPIPIAGGQGYLNFSDTFIFILASFISPLVGGLVGALSGSLSDIYAGYVSFAIWTAGIKFIEGIVAGYLFILLRKTLLNKGKARYLSLSSFYIGGLLMAFLYVIPDLVMADASVAIFDLPFNILQGVVNATIATVAFIFLSKISMFESVKL